MRLLPSNHDLGWTPYAWLIYLGFFVIQVPFYADSWQDWALAALALTIFIPLYLWGYWLEGTRIIPLMGAITLLGVLYAPVNVGSGAFFIYAAAFAGYIGRRLWGLIAIVFILAIIAAETLLLDLSFYFWVPAVVFSALIGGVNLHYGEVVRANRRAREAQEEMQRLAALAERERIARDLHDLLGHTLSLITIKSELAARLVEREPQRALRELEDITRISRDALGEVRATVRGYRSVGFEAELANAKLALEAADIAVVFDVEAVRLPPEQEHILSTTLREAVTNVIRHSEAARCRIALRIDHDTVRLEVEDDGCGGAAPEGGGLAGIRRRLEAAGGRLIRSTEDGTCLAMELPRSGEEQEGAPAAGVGQEAPA